MSEASSDLEEVIGNVDDMLKKEHDEAEKGIIRSAYNEIIHKVCQEQSTITVIQNRHLASVEFKKQAEEWLTRKPDINNLLSIKKIEKLKGPVKSDDYSEFEIRIKNEIDDLRNRVLEEISKEKEEYEKLTCLVRKWFPELPLLYPEAGILNYMLCVQNQKFGIKEDGTPEVHMVVMDDKVKSLFLNSFCCNRLTAEQVLRDDCFLVVDVISVSPNPGEEYEPHEEHDSEKTDKKNAIT